MSWRISRFISKEKVIERFPKWKPPKGARIKVEPLEWVVVKCGRCGKMWKESESPWD
jgi:hypothetical protein